MNKIIRKGSFDAGHRVLYQGFKCSNLHGHRYEFALEFSYDQTEELGYAIDFNEIKRIACAWIDDHLDHSFIVNPHDKNIIACCLTEKSRHYLMHLLDASGGCNPTVENIAKEIFFAVSQLMDRPNLRLSQVTLHETEKCIGICQGLSSSELATYKNDAKYCKSLLEYKTAKGHLEYDIRKVQSQ